MLSIGTTLNHNESNSMIVISMTAYRRPAYTRQVVNALADLRGISNCIFIACCEPGHDETWEALQEFDACERQLIRNNKRLGLNKNTREVLVRARKIKDATCHVHVEDDTVLSPDALEYFLWALTECDQKNIFSIAGHNRPTIEPPPETTYEARLRLWFTCWGWAMSRKNLTRCLANWCTKNPKSFAWHLNRQVRKSQEFEIHPQLSRVQNIGLYEGENERPAKWIKENHWTPYFAGDEPPGQWKLWTGGEHTAGRTQAEANA